MTLGKSFSVANATGRWVLVYSRFDNTADDPVPGDDIGASSSYRDGLFYAKFEIGF
jgi:hypothetical protein